MTDATADLTAMLEAVTDAFATGDNAHGEALMSTALDLGLAWDQVTAAVAQGVLRRRNGVTMVRQPATA
jgi:hypothetical protein